MCSAFEAVQYMKKIHNIVTFLKISDGNMQEGSFRCDANVSVRKIGDKNLGTRTELKNINSFKFVEKAINYEVRRQIELLEEGGKITQETRLYDENNDITKSMRSKEEANDYRYFPDPDLLPIEIDDEYILEIKKSLPELPEIKEKYYRSKYCLTDEQISILLTNQDNVKFIDEVIKKSKIEPKKIVNFFISSIYSKVNKENLLLSESNFTANDFCLVIASIDAGTLSKNNLRTVIDESWNSKDSISIIIDKYTNDNEDEELIDALIKNIINKNQKQVEEYKSGKTKILGFFVGQVLKDSKGSNPSQIKDKIIKILDAI
jgi:aspartyl-tRNA(Asn)/glutamyl-tRNA(Gln) amidotransferase subunit B